MSQQLLTISQLAKYVGVTVRAVRHYHALGLLPEPLRDSSGYRRYGADAVIRLTRIKTLADAGVPLSEIETLVEASADEFTQAVTSIKADISKRIWQLKETKQRLDSLYSGERMFVSEVVANYLESLRHMGLSEATVSYESDAWILISALYPKYADAWAAEKQKMIASPDIASLYLRLDEVQNWSTDDPRLRELAEDIVRLSSQSNTTSLAGQDELIANKQTLSLISQHSADAFPSLKRLRDTVEELAKNR